MCLNTVWMPHLAYSTIYNSTTARLWGHWSFCSWYDVDYSNVEKRLLSLTTWYSADGSCFYLDLSALQHQTFFVSVASSPYSMCKALIVHFIGPNLQTIASALHLSESLVNIDTQPHMLVIRVLIFAALDWSYVLGVGQWKPRSLFDVQCDAFQSRLTGTGRADRRGLVHCECGSRVSRALCVWGGVWMQC